jgi:uncharacterized RDD family membrane protein YckC
MATCGAPTRIAIVGDSTMSTPLEAMPSAVYASWGRRFVAWLLDSFIVLESILAVSSAVALATEDAASGIALFVLLAVLAPLYYAFFHAGDRGQTPGKRAVGASAPGRCRVPVSTFTPSARRARARLGPRLRCRGLPSTDPFSLDTVRSAPAP